MNRRLAASVGRGHVGLAGIIPPDEFGAIDDGLGGDAI
jgi:hypothetical protein